MDYPQQHIKPYDEEGKKTEQVERMFDNIAHAYDKLNHTLSLGIDRSCHPRLPQTATCRTNRHGHLGRYDECGT